MPEFNRMTNHWVFEQEFIGRNDTWAQAEKKKSGQYMSWMESYQGRTCGLVTQTLHLTPAINCSPGCHADSCGGPHGQQAWCTCKMLNTGLLKAYSVMEGEPVATDSHVVPGHH